MAHPRHRLDPAFQTPLRSSLMAVLAGDVEMDFHSLRELLETEDSPLSKAIGTLVRAGYVTVAKCYVGARPRTWVRATSVGRQAFARHMVALRQIAEGVPEEPQHGGHSEIREQ